MAWYKPVRTLFNPLVQALYPMPKSALIPVIVLWLGFGSASKILLIFIGCMLPITLQRVQRRARHRAGADLVGAQPGREPHRNLVEVVLPSALPEVLAASASRWPLPLCCW